VTHVYACVPSLMSCVVQNHSKLVAKDDKQKELHVQFREVVSMYKMGKTQLEQLGPEVSLVLLYVCKIHVDVNTYDN
jgi:hypothetical protein